MVKLSSEAKKIIRGKNFAHIATLMPDGSPQVKPVWVDNAGEFVLVNTSEGRMKYRNVKRVPELHYR